MKYLLILTLLLSSPFSGFAQEDNKNEAPAPATPPRPSAPPADPSASNRMQYHTHKGAQEIGSKEYEHVCEIGMANPTGFKVGDTIVIKGRTDARTGTEESSEFFNRQKGHKVLFVEDYKYNDDGNGGRVWIEGHPTTVEHHKGGTKNGHTFDGASVSKK